MAKLLREDGIWKKNAEDEEEKKEDDGKEETILGL